MAVTYLKKTKGGKITLVPRKLAADTKMVVNDILTTEDEFRDLYWSDKNSKSIVLEPPYAPRTLFALMYRNNTLLQCVSVMEVNIAGTGHEIVPDEELAAEAAAADKLRAAEDKFNKDKEMAEAGGAAPGKPPPFAAKKAFPPPAAGKPGAANPGAPKPGDKFEAPEPTAEEKLQQSPDKKKLEAFFNEPFPEQSFVLQRRLMTVDTEATGNGYLEVLRDGEDTIVMTRWLDSTTMRLCRLDDPIPVEKTVKRDGQEYKATVMMRERRFAQKAGTKMIYFKEFGGSRQINRNTGDWAAEGEILPLEVRGSEVIHFTCERDPTTSYGVPRWINQLPSILGSRKAEEYNLEFFDSGGMPPAVFFILGGAATPDTAEQLKAYLSGGAKNKHRAAVVEIQSTTGNLDGSAGVVNVKTERFGDTKTQDSMFQNYDLNTEKHVMGAFRIPPIFLGKSEDYNFATAMTAVMVTEEQVFEPEREEFDEIINKKIIRGLGVEGFELKSKAMSLKNAEVMLKGLELAADKVSGEEFIKNLNEVTGLTLVFDQETADKAQAMEQEKHQAEMGQMGADTEATLNPPPKPGGTKASNPFGAKKFEKLTPAEVLVLASRWSQAAGLEEGAGPMTRAEKATVLKAVEHLPAESRELFDAMVSRMTYARTSIDPEGLAKIAGCAGGHMH